jgi:hypothetical protein
VKSNKVGAEQIRLKCGVGSVLWDLQVCNTWRWKMDGQQNQSAGFSKSGKFLSLLRRDGQIKLAGKRCSGNRSSKAGQGEVTRHDTTRQRSG